MFVYIFMPRLPKKTTHLVIPRLTIPSAISNYKKGAKMSLIVYSTPTTPHFSPALKSLLTPSITEPTIVPLNESRKQPALFCVHPITGMSVLVFYFWHCQFGSYLVKSLFRSHIFSYPYPAHTSQKGCSLVKGMW